MSLPTTTQGNQAAIPWEGIRALSRHWAGTGSLFDWLPPPDWSIERDWPQEVVRARIAYAVLLYLNDTVLPHLPTHAAAWMGLLEQEIHRSSEIAEFPSVHTDWIATLSEYGRYPSTYYIERLPRGTFDTPLTRTLKWFCRAVFSAERLVNRIGERNPLSIRRRSALTAALELPEVQSAAENRELTEFDFTVCISHGGVWALIARSARLLAALWSGSATNQLFEFAPILPVIESSLFELSVLGVAVMAIQDRFEPTTWTSRTPIGAALSGSPCIVAEGPEAVIRFYYQTVPKQYQSATGPYRTLTQPLNGGVLRPDIWVTVSIPGLDIELMLECKYSLEAPTVIEGVSQMLAYRMEYPPMPDIVRMHIVICPDGMLAAPSLWKTEFSLRTPTQLRALLVDL